MTGSTNKSMKSISDEVTLSGKIESISITELRNKPGEVLKQVELGKVFVIERNGTPIAVLSSPPGETLTIKVGSDGSKTYVL